jgi:HK97 family phage prohead protease
MWQTLAAKIEYKEIGDAGTFTGYAAMFGNIDLGGDILERGAFKEFDRRSNGKIVILSQHNMRDPIGVADVEQDDRGLKFEGRLVLATPSGRRDHELMKAGVLDQMSMGYSILPGGAETLKSGFRQLKAIKLHEISPVTFAMNPQARIDGVKSLDTIRAYEAFLRDEGGFSHAQAKALASRGWGGLQVARDEHGEASAKVLDLINSTLKGLQS